METNIQTHHRIFDIYREKLENWSVDEDDDRIVYDTLKVQISERGNILFHEELSNFNIGEYRIGLRWNDQIISDLDLLEAPDRRYSINKYDKPSSSKRLYGWGCCAGGQILVRYRIGVNNIENMLEEFENYKIKRMNQDLKMESK